MARKLSQRKHFVDMRADGSAITRAAAAASAKLIAGRPHDIEPMSNHNNQTNISTLMCDLKKISRAYSVKLVSLCR